VVLLGGGGAALVTQPWSSGGGDSSSSTAGALSETGSKGSAEDAAAAPPVYATGTSYERASLPAEVRRHLLAGSVSVAPAAPDSVRQGADDRRLASPEALSSCLRALDVDPGHVTAVDLARFQGEPAALVVVRDDAGGQDVWVVGRGCRQGDDQTRYFARID
jgi:hypothetical protein